MTKPETKNVTLAKRRQQRLVEHEHAGDQNRKRNLPVVESKEKWQEKYAFAQSYSNRSIEDVTTRIQQECYQLNQLYTGTKMDTP